MKKIGLLFSVLLVLSCAQQVEEKNTLIIGVEADAITLFPYRSNDTPSTSVSSQIYDRLIEKDNKTGDLVPSLATEWKFLSPTILQMKIRSNVSFHNGETLTAKDVKYSIMRMIDSPAIAHILSVIDDIKIVDDLTVNLVFKTPFAPILSHLTHATASILNEKTAKSQGENIDTTPIGTGPFSLKEWARGNKIILTRFDGYWGEPAKMQNLEFRIIPEKSSRMIALETGEIDIALDIAPVDKERVEFNPDLVLAEVPLASIEYLVFNLKEGKNPLWQDPRVREAVALSLDVPGIINSVHFGIASPADSLIHESVVGHYDGLSPIVQNIDKAKALLAEAGVKQGSKLTIWTTDGPRLKTTEVIQANLREIGLDATIEVLEWGRFLEGTANGEHDTYVLGWTTATGDADYGIYNLVHSSAMGSPGNRSFYSNPETDRLLDLARKELDSDKRDALYKTIQEIVFKDLPYVPLIYRVGIAGHKKNVKNFQSHPTTHLKMKDISYEN